MNVETLYRTYGPMVLRRCRRLLGDEDSALDAMQDVFVRVLKNQDRLKATYPSSLLYRIATNVCLNHIRDQRMDIPGDEVLVSIAGMQDPEPRLDVDGLTLEEVAREVGMSVSGVRKRLRWLRESLKDLEEL